MRLTFIFLVCLVVSHAEAIDSSKCSAMMNDGLYKKYKWQGVGESNANSITGETKSQGTILASSKISTETSTAALDPKHWTHVSYSQTQSTSSTGECSAFALEKRALERDLYVAQNFDQIRKDIANGNGRHVQALAWFSLCDDSSQDDFAHELQRGYASLPSTPGGFGQGIDRLIGGAPSMSGRCVLLSKIDSRRQG